MSLRNPPDKRTSRPHRPPVAGRDCRALSSTPTISYRQPRRRLHSPLAPHAHPHSSPPPPLPTPPPLWHGRKHRHESHRLSRSALTVQCRCQRNTLSRRHNRHDCPQPRRLVLLSVMRREKPGAGFRRIMLIAALTPREEAQQPHFFWPRAHSNTR